MAELLESDCTADSAQVTSPRKQARLLQWNYFTARQPAHWRGVRVWFYPNGTIREKSLTSRNFAIPSGENAKNPQKIMEINTYYATQISNPFKQTKFLYSNGNPPTFARRLLPNGTLGPLYAQTVYVQEAGDWISVSQRTMGADVIAPFERFLWHPKDSKIRLSVLPIYRQSKLDAVLFWREVDGVLSYTTRFWSKKMKALPGKGMSFLDNDQGLWRGTKTCIFKNYEVQTSQILDVTGAGTLPSQPRERMSILQFPDNVTFHYPTTIEDYNKRDISFMILWNIDDHTAIQCVVDYDSEGVFSKTCTTTFTKTICK